MVLGKQVIGMGALGLALALACVPMHGQTTTGTTGATGTTGPQNVPDAPRPQTLPTLNPLQPVGPALPSAPTPSPSVTTTAPDGQTAPGTSLPGAPTPSPAAQDDADQGPPPDMTNVKSLNTVFVNFVEVPFTVKDTHNRLVPGITWRDVRVFENGQRQQMRLFTVDPFPLSVALVIDQTLTHDTMEAVNNSLAALQGAFTSYDEVSVFTYNNGVRMQTEFTGAQSPRLGVILERSKAPGRDAIMPLGGPLSQTTMINGKPVDPNTQPNHGSSVSGFETAPRESHTLLDAILAGAQEASKAPKGRRRIVYVISDGKEYGSVAKEREVIKYCQAHNVEVYATLVGQSAEYGMGFLDRIHLPLMMRDNILPRFAAATGGQIDPEFRQGGIEKSFARITEEVRTQYTVGYYTHLSPLNESFRKVEVRVLRPNLTVIAKEGYYPNASDSRPAPVTPSAVPSY